MRQYELSYPELHGEGNPAACEDSRKGERRGCKRYTWVILDEQKPEFQNKRASPHFPGEEIQNSGSKRVNGCGSYLPNIMEFRLESRVKAGAQTTVQHAQCPLLINEVHVFQVYPFRIKIYNLWTKAL